jgi:uncharacterized cupredoxin-like copper-binding protein
LTEGSERPLKPSGVRVDSDAVLVAVLRWTLAAALLACGLTACGSGHTEAAATTTVQVKEKDFRIVVTPSRARAGLVEFVVKNHGPDDHELIVVRARNAKLPMRHDGMTIDEAALEPRTVATLEPDGPGTTRRIRVQLSRGRYELFCNMAGHYMGGMHAFLVVS